MSAKKAEQHRRNRQPANPDELLRLAERFEFMSQGDPLVAARLVHIGADAKRQGVPDYRPVFGRPVSGCLAAHIPSERNGERLPPPACAKRLVYLLGKPDDMRKVKVYAQQAGRLALPILRDVPAALKVSAWEPYSPDGLWWLLLFNAVMNGHVQGCSARGPLIWLASDGRDTVGHDKQSLQWRRENPITPNPVPASWTTKLPDAWFVELPDAAGASAAVARQLASRLQPADDNSERWVLAAEIVAKGYASNKGQLHKLWKRHPEIRRSATDADRERLGNARARFVFDKLKLYELAEGAERKP